MHKCIHKCMHKRIHKYMQKIRYLPIILSVLLTGCFASDRPADRSFFAMDTYVTFTAVGKNAETALRSAEERIKELESLWSVTDENSEIYKLSHSGGEPAAVSAETAELIGFAVQMSEITGGSFDITLYPILTEWGFTTGEYKIPDGDMIAALLQNTGCEKIGIDGQTVTLPENMMLDLGGVGKGAAGDEAERIIRESGITSALLDLGGNIHAIGSKPDGSPWHIGIRDPDSDGTAGVLEVSDRAVVTSGGYERYFIGEDGNIYPHILDPATGRPAESGLASATVVGGEGRLCDALSTALFVMGSERAAELWRGRNDFEMLLITTDGKIIITEGLADSFEPSGAYTDSEMEVLYRK